jgi:hypothetical protein
MVRKSEEAQTKEAFDQQEMDIYRVICSKIFNYKIKLTNAFGLVREKYFEFYLDEHCSRLLFKLPREDIDVVSLGIRILSKNDEENNNANKKSRRRAVMKRTRLFTDASEGTSNKQEEEKSGDVSNHVEHDVSGINGNSNYSR